MQPTTACYGTVPIWCLAFSNTLPWGWALPWLSKDIHVIAVSEGLGAAMQVRPRDPPGCCATVPCPISIPCFIRRVSPLLPTRAFPQSKDRFSLRRMYRPYAASRLAHMVPAVPARGWVLPCRSTHPGVLCHCTYLRECINSSLCCQRNLLRECFTITSMVQV